MDVIHIAAQLAGQLVVDCVIRNSRNIHIDPVPTLQLQRFSLARGANQNIGRRKVGLKELKPGGQALGIGRENVSDDMFVGVVISIHFTRQKYLPAVADTLDGMSLLLCFAQCWQQHTSQNCNNRDDDQQFNESKTAFPAQPVSRRHWPHLSGTHSNVEFERAIAIFMTARGNRSGRVTQTGPDFALVWMGSILV